MAAFSGSKRRSPSMGGSGPYCSPETLSSPSRSHCHLSNPLNRPTAGPGNYHVASTHPPPPPGLQFQTNQSPNQSPWRSPIQLQTQFSSHIGGTPPSYPYRNSWRTSGSGSAGHGCPPIYSSRGRGFQSPNFRPGSSPSPNSGRGNEWQFRGSGSSPRRGRGGGHDRCSAWYDPQHQYKAMAKDPWRKLKPVVGNILVPRFGSGSWLPKSIAATKRAKVVESGARPQLSLA